MKKILLVGFFIFVSAANSFAGNLQTITSLSDLEGKAFNSKTQKQVLNSFAEYPLTKKMSVGAISQASRVESNHNQSTTAYAVNSVEIFNRYKIFSSEKLGIIMHNSYKFPGIYNENKYLALMPKQSDYEFRLLFTHNMPDRLVNTVVQNETPYFLRGEIAYRKRFSNSFDEFRFAFWGGVKINQEFSFLLQDNVTWNVNAKATSTNNSYSNAGDFRAVKDANNIATFSLLYHFDKNTALQAGYVRRLHGNNPFYDNRGVIVGLWKSF